jgi:hypothetical protein
VIRYLDAKGNDLTPKKGSVFSLTAVAGGMKAALEAAKRPVPDELTKLAKKKK